MKCGRVKDGNVVNGEKDRIDNAMLRPAPCAICGTLGNAVELYPANFSIDSLNPSIFSARRLPDRVHFRIVQCKGCSLVRSDPVAESGFLHSLYAQSKFDYVDEVRNLQLTYGKYLDKVRPFVTPMNRLLEIGCGNGFFLEEAMRRGCHDVWGVEPSTNAISNAPSRLRNRIIQDTMRPGLFQASQFDVICMFQVFDHVPEPSTLLAECMHILRPGGAILCLNHDVQALSARVMKAKSPIIDIEHTYLYSKATLKQIFQKAGFEVLQTGRVWNRYRLYYLSRLLPLPRLLKQAALRCLDLSQLGRLSLNVLLGNLYQIARKPFSAPAA